MAKRKKKEESPLDKQVIDNDTLTIADVKQFIADAKKKKADFVNIADRSWNEIEKRNKKGRLHGGNDLDRARRWTKFPLWWSVWKIRQPITFARLPIPVLKDTQGDDPFGRTACVIGERFVRNILKTFDAFSEFSSSVDDFLITNFGWGRVFYRKEDCIEEEKLRLQEMQQEPPPPMLDEAGQPIEMPMELPPIFVTPDGQPVENAMFDDLGAYVLTGQNITVENEEVYFKSGLYCNLDIDPYARKWSEVSELSSEEQYSYREFKHKFGQAALDKLSQGDIEEHRNGKPIIVAEYQSKTLKEVRWFAENSEDFFQPTAIAELDPQSLKPIEDGKYDNSDLFGLTGFYNIAEPLLINASTKEFWPTPEFFQVNDILDDIHSIVGRMFLLTKAIRVRFLYDSSVTALNQLIGETGEGGGLGVPNLEQSLMNNNGSLANLVAYFPVEEMITGLTNMYTAFEQRLNMFYQVTGISDLIRGQTNPDSDKTFGERQMEGKFALNRVEPLQRKIQEWIKDNYQLLMEMGLKMFSDKSIDEYITPQTLDQEDKDRYVAALELLRNNKKRRFRVDFETDSTIAVNEQWKRSQAIETANVITKMMEGIAKVAETQPELAATELKIAKHVVGELTDGKLFIDEIQDSIEQVIEKVSQPKEPEPNIDLEKLKIEAAKLQLDGQKLSVEARFNELKLQSESQLEIARLQQAERFEAFANQLSQIKMANEAGLKSEELSQKAAQLQADIMLAQQDLAARRNEFLLQAQDIANKAEAKQIELVFDARVKDHQKKLDELYFSLEKEKTILDEKEKYMTEQRLQSEHQLNTVLAIADMQKSVKELEINSKNLPAINVTVQAPEPKEQPKPEPIALPAPKAEEPKERKRRKIKTVVKRDKNGELIEAFHEEID